MHQWYKHYKLQIQEESSFEAESWRREHARPVGQAKDSIINSAILYKKHTSRQQK